MTSHGRSPEPREPLRRSSSRIVPRERAARATIPIWPATFDDDELREAMGRAFDEGDAGGALFYAELLLRCYPDDTEAQETALRSRVALEEMFAVWLGGWTLKPRLVIEAALLPLLDVEPQEVRLLDDLDGTATVRDLVCATPLPALDVLRLLFALAHRGAIVLA